MVTYETNTLDARSQFGQGSAYAFLKFTHETPFVDKAVVFGGRSWECR